MGTFSQRDTFLLYLVIVWGDLIDSALVLTKQWRLIPPPVCYLVVVAPLNSVRGDELRLCVTRGISIEILCDWSQHQLNPTHASSSVGRDVMLLLSDTRVTLLLHLRHGLWFASHLVPIH